MKIKFSKFLLLIVFIGLPLSMNVFANTSMRVRKAADKVDQAAPNLVEYFDPDENAKDEKAVEESTGSLWVSSYNSNLYNNMHRASRVGDTVMIVIDEQSKGSNTGNTKSDKKAEHTASVDALGGIIEKFTKFLPLAFNPSKIISGTTDSKFTGDASTKRQNQLTGRLTATVSRVLKNGNMVIRGEQHLKVNKDDQILIIEGLIRPYDISPDNVVLSSAVADARISYSGFGVVADRQSPGWLMRVLDHIWPF
jgi:flagellar L-ring protein precursor FlgH